jgi:hypothetical protein
MLFVARTWKWREWYGLFGRKSLHIYVIHLALLWGTPWFDGIARYYQRQLSLPEGFGIVALVMVTTLLLAWGIDRYERSEITATIRSRVRWGIGLTLGYLLLV